MPQTGPRSGASGVDRISVLPDAVLQHVLGFLPADEAVRTNVVASRWRHLWSSLGRLRVVCPDRWSAPGFRRLVDRVLLGRDPACALDEVEFVGPADFSHSYTNISAWIRHALLCQASSLSVRDYVALDGRALVSRHLTKLELVSMYSDGGFLDFSSCPVLRSISITRCFLKTEKIISQSVERLCIKECGIKSTARVHISVPSLIWLHIDCVGSKAPLLESTPSLQTAFVKYSMFVADRCNNGQSGECCGVCTICRGNDNHDGQCLLLKGVSSATVLELIARRGMPIFNRDLRWCPTFSKLKTLLLNDWCVVIDLHALVCILKHSPILEKLTIQLAKEPKSTAESEVSFEAIEQLPEISEYLTTVEIKCQEVDGRVCRVIKLLSRFGKKITIIPDSTPSTCFSFE